LQLIPDILSAGKKKIMGKTGLSDEARPEALIQFSSIYK
jgi:hypothetical protein